NSATVLTPPIFADVKRVRSVFTLVGERTFEEPLGNNMSVVDGVVREGLKLTGVPDQELDSEVQREIQRTHQRRADLNDYIGQGIPPFVVASPKPAAGIGFVDVNGGTMADLQLDSLNRIVADISFVTEPGNGVLMAPADCPLIDIVDPRPGGQVVQIHAGWQGLRLRVVRKGMALARERGLDMANALVHIHPNATDGFELGGEGLESWIGAFDGDFTTTVNDRSYISMTDAAIGQLEEAGIKPEHIQTSSAYSPDGKDFNSLIDNRFFSHRAKGEKGFGGRNAGVLVRVSD
ncbi:MAG: copper oxidase, partial [Candidatus Saccharibacteria bacterium]|nr:copper oxidase [Candidatus Saccharibacteria bacterium]